MLAIGFALVILLGAFLLTLPIASKDRVSFPFINALFIATSCTCVTGLSVVDIYTQFSGFGQAVMLTLIQIGGLGFMAVAMFFSMILRKRIGLRERFVLKESLGALKIGGIIRLVRRMLIGTAIFEVAGAIALAFRFCPQFGFWRGIWYSVFHSVSAFCNAGFDLIGIIAPSTSLAIYVDDVLVNVVIMSLIVIGGIGFIVWDDIIENRFRFRRYRLQSKIVLSSTFFLIVAGAVAFYFTEANYAFSGMPFGQRVLASLFQSVTPRTAGFCTVDMSTLSEGGSALTSFLMFVGASPGSTGGGLKTTTFFVMIFSVLSYARKQESVNIFHRKIEDAAVRRAFNSAMLYLMLAGLGIIIIHLQGVSFESSVFEVFSAIGTVGLTKGVTPNLTVVGKLVDILLMYAGRVGSLSIAMAISERRLKPKTSNVTEKIITG